MKYFRNTSNQAVMYKGKKIMPFETILLDDHGFPTRSEYTYNEEKLLALDDDIAAASKKAKEDLDAVAKETKENLDAVTKEVNEGIAKNRQNIDNASKKAAEDLSNVSGQLDNYIKENVTSLTKDIRTAITNIVGDVDNLNDYMCGLETCIETVEARAGDAVSIANTANTNATTATTTATNAATAAATAQSTANTAKTNAATALTCATDAATAASTAKTRAADAQLKADQAYTYADTANSNANTAKSCANTAKTNAANAATAASTAQSTANTAKTNAATALTCATDAMTEAKSKVTLATLDTRLSAEETKTRDLVTACTSKTTFDMGSYKPTYNNTCLHKSDGKPVEFFSTSCCYPLTIAPGLYLGTIPSKYCYTMCNIPVGKSWCYENTSSRNGNIIITGSGTCTNEKGCILFEICPIICTKRKYPFTSATSCCAIYEIDADSAKKSYIRVNTYFTYQTSCSWKTMTNNPYACVKTCLEAFAKCSVCISNTLTRLQ